ncbi:unnamed protein product [Rhizophagus irregularis]|nr:unnamed protein product [Rhizophagus irregularis]
MCSQGYSTLSDMVMRRNKGPDIDFPLKLIDTIKAKDTHAWPLLETRKLDFVFIQRDSTLDPLNVVVVGEIKMRIGEGFSNTQAISFGEKVTTARIYVYSVDGLY